MRVLLDTHAWVWSLFQVDRLSKPALRAIQTSTEVFVSPISCFEICQKVRLGTWPEMEAYAADLPMLIGQQNARVAALGADITTTAGLMGWPHRDPFDRIVAATAETYNLSLVSADTVFDTFGSIRRIW